MIIGISVRHELKISFFSLLRRGSSTSVQFSYKLMLALMFSEVLELHLSHMLGHILVQS
jgi:hypothetical protein